MCGINAIIKKEGSEDLSSKIIVGNKSLSHRGPDASSSWFDNKKRIFLGHTRLSIIDLHERSTQPMSSFDGRYHIIFNGEIYNYVELRRQCEALGSQFNTQSDTEVVMEMYRHYGIQSFKQFLGMWAFIIFDSKADLIVVSRDFFGIKPLYYAFVENSIAFSSEPKSLIAMFPQLNEEDLVTTKMFKELGTIERGCWTFFKNIKKFPQSHYAIIDLNNTEALNLRPQLYCDIDDFPKPENTNLADMTEQYMDLLDESVRLHTRADVPIGFTLSGGLDSTSIATLASKYSSQITAFTTKYHEYPEIDESEQALRVSRKIGCKHIFAQPSLQDFTDSFKSVLEAQGEPFGSTSIFSQYFVFQKIGQSPVKVCLDGQGADESLGGYKFMRNHALRAAYSGGSKYFAFKEILLARLFDKNDHFINQQQIRSFIDPKNQLRSLSQIINTVSDGLYEERVDSLKINTNTFSDLMLSMIFETNLPQLLRYQDRNSMHFSIESRVPFLNPKLIFFSTFLSSKFLIRNGYTKYILRNAMRNFLPDEILWQRKKLGFPSPEKDWLKKFFSLNVSTNGSLDWRELNLKTWRNGHGF